MVVFGGCLLGWGVWVVRVYFGCWCLCVPLAGVEPALPAGIEPASPVGDEATLSGVWVLVGFVLGFLRVV